MFNGSTMGIGIGSDGVFATGTGVNLTTAWGVDASYEHIWSKRWQTAVHGSYTETSYNANANTYLCTAELTVAKATGTSAFGGALSSCDNNVQTWDIGTRTQFNLDANTYLGVDVVYETLKTGLAGLTAIYGNGAATAATGPRTISDQSAWMVQFRVHCNFYP